MITRQELRDRLFQDCDLNKGWMIKRNYRSKEEYYGVEVLVEDNIVSLVIRDYFSTMGINLKRNTTIEDIDHLIRILNL